MEPKYVVAPMVDASELAWRLLCRRHGAQLCYTPMLHAELFVRDAKYRRDALQSCPTDRPLVVQFCGNDPDTLVRAAKIVEPHCDAVDVNLGCPQAIARRGRYGAFLQDDWPLLASIVSALAANLSVPVTCKIRVFPDKAKTVDYAKMLEAAGCRSLTVHGRTREQKGPMTGIASWDHIKAVKEAVSIPVFANGNIQYLSDVERCLEATGADGVMTAEGNLANPMLFVGISPPVWEPCAEYLELVAEHPCPSSFVRGHLFKMCHALLNLPSNSDVRSCLASAQSLDDFKSVVSRLKQKYEPYHNGDLVYVGEEGNERDFRLDDYNLKPPPWTCRPYMRPPIGENGTDASDKLKKEKEECKRNYEDADGNPISRKKMKKLRRILRRPPKPDDLQSKRSSDVCSKCPNPQGTKCCFGLCKKCCKNKCFDENFDCPGHRILVKTRRELAMKYSLTKEASSEDAISQSVITTEVENI